MHPLRNGSQVTARPARKATAGTPGYFSESNDNNQPSYPGQDWFNDVIDEFKNALAAANIAYLPGDLTHLAQLFDAVRSQEWSSLINYSIGQEVVFNGSRYISLSQSGPDNGGAVEPGGSNLTIWFELNPIPFSSIANRTAIRAPNITYQNDSKARQVCITLNANGPGTRVLTITPQGGSSIFISRVLPNVTNSSLSFDVVVPPYATYSFDGSFSNWVEVE
ncbi:hypothetical protein KW541_10310 [Vibrio fluvialis]|nr:hypothetical protein [Vibrio fluvialis]